MSHNRIRVCLALLLALTATVAAAPAGQQASQPQTPLPPLLANKTVSRAQASWGDTLAYTITLTNTSVISPLATLLTDTLPLSLVFQPGSLSASEGSLTHTAQTINWSGTITPSGVITISLQAVVSQVSTTITNVAVAQAGGAGLFQTPVVSTTIGQAHLYLPTVARLPAGISGRVNLGGAPAGGVPLQLRFYDGANWSTVASLSTAGDGSYLFNPPALGAGQKYYVLFHNESDPSRLFTWGTRLVTSFQPADSVFLGDFDIVNFEQSAPGSGAHVGLPTTFQWGVRPATPSDSYEFNITDRDTNSPFFYTDPPLGYTGSYLMSHLPPGFQTNHDYIWFLWVYDDQGGYGISYWSYFVSFANAGLELNGPQSAQRIRTADLSPQLREPK